MAYNINEATRKLKEVIELCEQGKAPDIDSLKEAHALLTDENIIYIPWATENVLHQAESRGLKITQEQAQEVLYNMERKHDCEYGITWTTIDCWLDDLDVEEEGDPFED